MTQSYENSPTKFCYNTSFNLPKQSQRSRSKMDLDLWDCFGRKKIRYTLLMLIVMIRTDGDLVVIKDVFRDVINTNYYYSNFI